jgi:hypothetical protein
MKKNEFLIQPRIVADWRWRARGTKNRQWSGMTEAEHYNPVTY